MPATIMFPVQIHNNMMPRQCSKRYLTRAQAATIIQRTYRRFRRQKLLRNLKVDAAKKPKKTEVLKKTKKGVLGMFNMVKNHFEGDQKRALETIWLQPKRNLLEEGSLFHELRETVIVFGGLDPHNPLGFGRNTGKDMYRYIPIANCWEFIGELPEPRHHHCSEFYKGRIFLVGGSDPRGNKIFKDAGVTSSVWSYDPVSRKWFQEPSLMEARKNFGLVSATQGLYALGGQGVQYEVLESVERYNMDKGVWEQMQPMLTARTGFACTKLKNNIWVVGGISGSDSTIDILDSTETYDIKTNQWTELKYPLRFPRCFSSMFVLSDKLYLIGGASKSFEVSKEGFTTSIGAVDLWNDKRLEWNEVAQLNIARHGQAVSCLGTQILIVGGVTTAYGRALSSTECFCTQRAKRSGISLHIADFGTGKDVAAISQK